MTRVFPLPAPASSSKGPSVWSTASRCCGFKPARKSMTSGRGERFQNTIQTGLGQATRILFLMSIAAVVALVKSALLVLSALVPIVNPLGTSPIFLSLTAGYSSSSRTILSRKIALNSFWLLAGSMLIGSHILNFFGISIPVVQVGGGLVVISAGWRLLQQEPEEARATAEKQITNEDIANRAFYPLTLPLTVGPGSISVALTLGASEMHRSQVVRLVASLVGPAL